jgi:hypothetical protein
VSLLVDRALLDARRAAAAGPLSGLATSLRAELQPVVDGAWEIPREKAMLTRSGGRCPDDGTLLSFDPFDPRHRCPRCGREVRGEEHDRFRPYWYQLWLAERTVHAALLGVVLDDARCIATASAILDALASRYLQYPNRDNVLGPSRPFFSTYLESIWLLQIVDALDLLETGAPSPSVTALGGRVRETLVAPSLALIASFDEGMSNRQVWNDAAIIAAGSMLGEESLIDRALHGPSGLSALLEGALLGDGSWYEGENYHLFAHRGLWYGVTMAERRGTPPAPALVTRFDAGFAAAFRTLLPDLTYPSRRDSQYAVSVRQPRFAESCELGVARTADPRLLGVLARLYDPSVPRRDTGRAASTADVERNVAATGLTRADLSWRSLLFALRELPPLPALPLPSDILPDQGFAVLRRRDGEIYVGLDYGHSGGGHGHPDRLNLLLSEGSTRWFDDPGTGSYVDESLHWYRSTLAHTAPLLDGHSQPRVDGDLIAFDIDADASWVSAHASLEPGCTVKRSVVVLDDYLVDALEWEADDEHEVALPFHGVRAIGADETRLPVLTAPIPGGTAREDGFSFLRETARVQLGEAAQITLRGEQSSDGQVRSLRGWIVTSGVPEVWSALAPGPPGAAEQPLVLVRVRGRRGSMIGVWSWSERVIEARISSDSIVVERADYTEHSLRRTATSWRIEVSGDDARILELGGVVAHEAMRSPSQAPHEATPPSPLRLPARFELGAAHYRRSEATWDEAGRPTCSVSIEHASDGLIVTVDVPRAERRFVPIDAENPMDNDPAAIHGDGVQLYVDAGSRSAGWLLVPIPGSERVGVRIAEGWNAELEVDARWHPVGEGYQFVARVGLPPSATEVGVDVLVNEIAPGRVRRRGQLVLSGARGEFVYLRSDRHERSRLLRFALGSR